MNSKISFGSRLWLPCLLGLSLMASSRVGHAQVAPPFTSLYSFNALDLNNDNLDGADIRASLIQAKDGSLYGTSSGGFDSRDNDGGTLYKITTGGKFTGLSLLPPNRGGDPYPGTLVQDSDGIV